ncbi:MAG: hypothetical protein ABJA67_15225 [Chthonomonadales bacterium]
MSNNLWMGLLGTGGILFFGYFMAFVVSMFMTGIDLRNKSDMAFFILFMSIIGVIVISALFFLWRWVLH